MKALSFLIFALFGLCVFGQTYYDVGSGTSTSSSDAITPYSTYYHDGKHQYLILASELTGQGALAGDIVSLAFDVTSNNTYTMNGFTVKLGQTALGSLPGGAFEDDASFTTCYSSNVSVNSTGWFTHVFSSNFSWDGSSNIIVQVCFDNTGYSSSSTIRYSTTAFTSNVYGYEDGGSGCSQAYTAFSSRGSSTSRPNMQLGIIPSAPCTTPADQPTALVFSNITENSIDGSFTVAVSSPDNYLVVISTSPTLSANPVDGVTYSNGDPLGGGTVVQAGSSLSFSAAGLALGTQYFFFVFSYNMACAGGPLYNTTSPLSGTETTISCPDPDAFSAANLTGTTADLGWTDHAGTSQWDIELGLTGFSPTGTPTQAGVTSNPYTYMGLSPNTGYDFYVRADCGAGDYSGWAGPFSFFTTALIGQVYVSATLGTTSGVYSTVKAAFDKVNDGTHRGDITITIGANDGENVTETSEAVLNKSGSGSASYTSVFILPGASNISVTSSLAGACCEPTGTLKLNEAENVIVDGRQGATGTVIDLTIENSSTSTWSSAFVFYGASNNQLKYCMVKSSTATTSGGVGVISFNDNATSGCSYNLVESCHITKSGTNLPTRAIGSKGWSTRLHTADTIRNCDIYDFEEFGIFLGSSSSSEGYNRDWVIEGNNIYQKESFSNQYLNQIGICIGYPYSSSSTGQQENGSFTICNNYVGGNGSGGDWVWGCGGAYLFAGIYVYGTWSGNHTCIDGNVISDMSIQSANTSFSSTSKPIFGGIIANNCKVRIGSSIGNIVGSLTDTSSIEVEQTNSTSGYVAGIKMSSNSDVGSAINNNVISGFSMISGSDNLVSFYGIHNNSATTNTSDSICNNLIAYISSTMCNYFYGISANGYLARNKIRDIDFTGAATFSELLGIFWWGGNRIENNEIILGKNLTDASVAQNDEITGIEVTSSPVEVYYNSVLIYGTSTGTDLTRAILMPNTTEQITANNLFYNERSGGSGNHYAIYQQISNPTYWTSNNNAYIIGTGANNYLGYWSGAQTDLASWQSVSGETNSIESTSAMKPTATLFPVLGLDSLDVTDTWLVAGVPVVPVTDIKNNSRDAVTPTVGAYELSSSLPVEWLSFSGKRSVDDVILNWTTASETNNDYFLLERSSDGETFEAIAKINGKGNSNNVNYYSFIDYENNSPITYYRLKQVDFNGAYSYSKLIVVRMENSVFDFNAWPNPVEDNLQVEIPESSKDLVIEVFTSTGQLIEKQLYFDLSSNEILILHTDKWSSGLYYIQFTLRNNLYRKKVIKN